jgi:hypothetical protein
MSKTFNSKLATSGTCVHGFNKPFCTECFPIDPAQEHHEECKNVNAYLGAMGGHVTALGGPEGAQALKNTMFIIAEKHAARFPGCRSCGAMRDAEYAPPTPTTEELAEDVIASYNDEPADVAEPTSKKKTKPTIDYSFE